MRFVTDCNNLYVNTKVFENFAVIDSVGYEKFVRCNMEQQNSLKLDEGIERDIKECKEKVEFLEKVLTMIVKGFASEY